MGLYQRNGRYYFFKQIDGIRYRRSLGLKRGEEYLLSERIKQVEKEIIATHYGLSAPGIKRIRLKDYIKIYLQEHQHKKTIDRDDQRLKKILSVFGNIYLQQINKQNILKLENYLLKELNVSTTTVNRYMELLRHLLNCAIRDKYISENPVSLYYVPYVEEQKRRALNLEEINLVLDATKQIQQKPRSDFQKIVHDVTLFAFLTGMRLSEILFLEKKNINLQESVIILPHHKTKSKKRSPRKTQGEYKIIPLSLQSRQILEKHIRKSRDKYVFSLKWRNPNTVFYTVKKIRRLTGIKDFSFHVIRHTVATVLASQNIAMAQAMLGHSDIQTTIKYTHPFIDHLKTGISVLENLLNSHKNSHTQKSTQ